MRRCGFHPLRVRMFDASRDGCRIEFLERPTIEERVWIRFDGIEGIEGNVRWVDGHHCGVQFHHSIHDAVFARIVAIEKAREPANKPLPPMQFKQAGSKADVDEEARRYSTCEWWLDGRTLDPREHLHADDHAYFIMEGVLTLHLEGERFELSPGSYTVVRGGTPHEFANESIERVGFLTFRLIDGQLPPSVASEGAASPGPSRA